MSARVQANHQAKRHGLMNDLRVTLDEMTRSIKDFRLRPLSPGVASLVQPRDSFDEPLEVGSLVYFKQTDAAQKTSADLYRVSGLDLSSKNLSLKRKPEDEAEKPVVVTRNCSSEAFPGVYSAETHSIGAMTKDIKQLTTASWRLSAGCTWLIPSSAPSRCSPSCGSSSPTWPRATRRCARRWRR